jgi:hypothetical protein
LDDKFVVRQLHEIEQCNPYDLIFSEATLAKFQKRNTDDVLFVTEDQRIKGVVHIVDYNREFIFTEFYKLIFGFETMLREFLYNNGFNNSTILEYYRAKADGDGAKPFWRRRLNQIVGNKATFEQRQFAFGPLQIFYLSDLLNYYAYMDLITEEHKLAILKIRNKIAHSVDIISQQKNDEAEKLYNFEGLRDFITDSVIFFNHFEKLENELNELITL